MANQSLDVPPPPPSPQPGQTPAAQVNPAPAGGNTSALWIIGIVVGVVVAIPLFAIVVIALITLLGRNAASNFSDVSDDIQGHITVPSLDSSSDYLDLRYVD